MTIVLAVRNLRKAFPSKNGRIPAVDNISFTIKKGEIFGLLGVNGAGKSTTINMLSGLTLPDSGSITIFGKDFLKHREEISQRFNVATAYYHLGHNLSVWQNMKVYADLYGVQQEEKIIHLAEQFAMKHILHTKVRSLSSGEKTRLVLMKSLLNDPELLFLDECTVGLDPDMAEVTREYLRKYNQEQGCTIIFTSHYMQEVERLCHRIAFMEEGRIVKIGKAKDLIKELKVQTVTMHFTKKIEGARKLLQALRINALQQGNTLIFQVKNERKVIFQLVKLFVQNNIIFDDLHLNKPSLEEYFIYQARRGQEDGARSEVQP